MFEQIVLDTSEAYLVIAALVAAGAVFANRMV